MEITIYHYEPTYKFYLGCEVVEDRRPSVGLPAFSTGIRPPLESCPDRHVPIFNGAGWDIIQDNFWRPKSVEQNYDAGRPMSSYHPLALSIYCKLFPAYPSMPMLCNSSLVVTAICQKIRMIHSKFETILNYHELLLSQNTDQVPIDSPNYDELASAPSLHYMYKLEAESMVFLMRRVLDSLVQLTYLLTNYKDFERTKVIKYNAIGQFIKVTDPTKDIEKIIIGDERDYKSDHTGFFSVINDLFNSFKHCLMHDESNLLIGTELPTITSFQAKYNNHNEIIIHHNYNAYHLMMGFQDNVERILFNQREYVNQKKARLAPLAINDV